MATCEACGSEYEKGSGRGHNNRVFCHTCTSSPNISDLRNRNKHLKRNYGITLHEEQQLFAKQGGGCAICGTSENQWGFVVDHCHSTGRVRGILCHSCNVALGHVRDDLTILRRMIHYLS